MVCCAPFCVAVSAAAKQTPYRCLHETPSRPLVCRPLPLPNWLAADLLQWLRRRRMRRSVCGNLPAPWICGVKRLQAKPLEAVLAAFARWRGR